MQKMEFSSGRIVVAVDGGAQAACTVPSIVSLPLNQAAAVSLGLYEFYKVYAAAMESELRALVSPSVDLSLVLAKDGSGLGAALLCAAAE